uniref:Uncharacterized protein n=1 Tax=Equus asinus TaxID=9793 RepID=A0A9L0KDG7_EQUAS
MVLLLAVQRLLDNQLWELSAVAAGLDVQREEAVVVAREQIDLLVVGEHLEGQLALGVVAAQGLAVDALLGVEEPAVGVHVQQVRRRVLQNPVATRLAAPAAATAAALCGWKPWLQSSILADVADHRAGPLLLRHGVV